MKKLLKKVFSKKLIKVNKKGMSLVEVLVALTLLAVLSVPIMMVFMNTQLIAKKVDVQTTVSSVTRVVKQLVVNNVLDNTIEMRAYDSSDPNRLSSLVAVVPGVANPVTFRGFVESATEESPELPITSLNGTDLLDKYTYKITSCASYNDPALANVYNVLIKIIDRSNNKVVEQVRVDINIPN